MNEAPPPYSGPDNKSGGQNQYQQQYGATTQGQPYPPQQGQTSVIYTQPVTVVHMFRECPLRTVCQFCSAEVVTSTYYENGTLTWLACFFIFLFFPLGCCLIPFCMDGMKDVVHRCPNCNQQVGRYNRM